MPCVFYTTVHLRSEGLISGAQQLHMASSYHIVQHEARAMIF